MVILNKYSAIFLFFFSVSIFGQSNINKLSFETNYGYSKPIAPFNKIYNSKFAGFRHFNIGLRYMFSETIGVKISYKTDHFVNDPGGLIGISYNTYSISGVYNFGKLMGLTYYSRDKFSVYSHLDFGLVFANPIGSKKIEKVRTIGLGITPMYRVSNKLALTSDFTHNITLQNHYGFDGNLLDPVTKKTQSGSYVNFTFGFIYYIGENKYHSDWY